MWSSRRSTEVPVTKEESTAKVRCFEACNTMRADKEKITSLNEQRTKQTFNYTVWKYQNGALQMRISEMGHLLGQGQFKQYRDGLILFEMRMK